MTFHRKLTCPHCKKGKVFVDDKAKGLISVECCRCSRFYIGNLETLRTEKSKAQKNNLVS